MALRPVLSMDFVFKPTPWHFGEVVPIFDDNGDLILYAQYPASGERESLPIEFFHHQLEDLDVNDPCKVASFMSEYGLLGNFRTKGVTEWDIAETLARCDSPSLPDRDAEIHDDEWAHLVCSGYMGQLEKAMRSQFLPNYPKNTFKYRHLQLGLLFEPLPVGLNKGCIRAVTPSMFQYEYAQLMHAAFAVEELVSHSDTVKERLRRVIDATGVYNLEWKNPDSLEFVHHGIDCLNRHIHDLPLYVGYCSDNEPEPIFPFSPFDSGSLEQAIALQMHEFIYNCMHDGFFICSRCGHVFAKKQSKATRSRRPVAGFDAFCCDKCKAAKHSEKHRRTEGYRNKQAKNKENRG